MYEYTLKGVDDALPRAGEEGYGCGRRSGGGAEGVRGVPHGEVRERADAQRGAEGAQGVAQRVQGKGNQAGLTGMETLPSCLLHRLSQISGSSLVA